MDKQTLAKLLAHTTVSATTARSIAIALSRSTSVSSYAIPVLIITGVIGELIAQAADKYTDQLVERLFAWLEARKSTEIVPES